MPECSLVQRNLSTGTYATGIEWAGYRVHCCCKVRNSKLGLTKKKMVTALGQQDTA